MAENKALVPVGREVDSSPHVVTLLVVLAGIVSGSWLLVVGGALWHLSSVLGWREVMAHKVDGPVARHLKRRRDGMWDEVHRMLLDLFGVEDEQEVVRGGRVLAKDGPRPVQVSVRVDGLARANVVDVGAAVETAVPAFLDVLEGEQAILIVGAKGTGKTTAMRWLLHRRSGVIVLDPHNAPGKWGQAKVFGGGRNYVEIGQRLSEIHRFMDRRYKQMDSGEVVEGEFGPLWVVIDEGRSVMLNVKGAGEVFRTLLTEARKVAINVVLANHSSLVGALGLEGASDLKEGLCMVHLREVDGARSATVDKGGGAFVVRMPGEYLTVGSVNTGIHTSIKPNTSMNTGIDPQSADLGAGLRRQQIEVWLRRAWSMNRIYNELGGDRNAVMAEIRVVKEEIGLS